MPSTVSTASERAPDALAPASLLATCRGALRSAKALEEKAGEALRARVVGAGARLDPERLEAEQFAAHGLAWLATYVAALAEMLHWAERLDGAGRLGELERLLLQAAFGEYLSQIRGGIAMSQAEVVRPDDMGLSPEEIRKLFVPEARALVRGGNTAEVRARIAGLIEAGAGFGEAGLLDEMLEAMRSEMRRFADEEIAPFAQEWHRKDALIPLEVLEHMAELGVFALTVPEEYGGLGLGKIAMCVVTEELSRGYLSVGSIGTRAEIAAELIATGGTEAQKREWLPKLASGEVLPTAVFTEPDTGSDLGALKTRAVREGGKYRIAGNKTWTTHGARSDLMTLLARTNPEEKGYKGLSMFLAPKPRGTDADPFPARGMTGTEIPVLGYRGMKEYEIAFDGFEIDAENLLGAEEGQGFKQLMRTFEAARVQTAARAVGVAQNALELGLAYAKARRQFGKAIYAFPRVSGKLAWLAVETMVARQLTYFAAREKDAGRRSDMAAGMAKLLAARVAWAAADAALQIHGGNGYALEYAISRVLCDARILNIFEGAAEIQAHVIARRLLEG